MVLLHGAPSPAADFDPLVDRLAKMNRVLIPSLPGYGKSPPLEPYLYDTLYAHLEHLLQRHHVSEAVFIGFAVGGYHALSLATRARIKPRAVAVLGGFAGLTGLERAEFEHLAMTLAMSGKTPSAEVRAAFMKRMLAKDPKPDHRERVEAWLDLTKPAVLIDEMKAAAKAPDLYEAVARLEVPLLIRVGEQDEASPKYLAERLAAAARSAELQVVPGAGHALLIEDEPGTVNALAEWLEKALDPKPPAL